MKILHVIYLFIYFGGLQNPNTLESKALLDFDHVKNSLKVDDEGKKFTSPY